MYKILLIDDFLPDLEALCEMIQSLVGLNVIVVEKCNSAFHALELLPVCQPDIIISDIKMPGMDGFSLARAVRRDYPQIKFIFTSLYSEFEYARKALYLDSYGYLLKPIDSQEVRDCLTRVTSRLSDESQHVKEYEEIKFRIYENLPFLVESFIRDLIYGLNHRETTIFEQAQFLGLPASNNSFALLLVEIDDYLQITGKLNPEQKQVISLRVYERLKELLNHNGTPVRLDGSHFGLLVWGEKNQSAAYQEEMLSQFSERILNEFSQSDLSLSLAASTFCKDLSSLNHLYEQCCFMIRFKYSLGKGKLIRIVDIPIDTVVPEINYNAIQKELRFLLGSGGREELTNYLEILFKQSPQDASESYHKNLGFCLLICTQIVLNDHNVSFQSLLDEKNRLVWDQLLRFETVTDAQKWIKELLLRANQHLRETAADKNRKLTVEVKQYIQDHWNHDLSLETVASDFHFSANYLNLIFKQETGETIFEYTCKIKIEKAKEMLTDPKLKLYQLTELLGYTSPVYFNNVFRKYTGLTPKEYRERHI